MRVLMAFAFVLALTMGCAHVPAPRTLETSILGASGRNGSIVFADGSVASGRAVRVSRDFVSWTDPRTGNAESVAAAQVDEIRIPNRGRGVLRGLGYGFLIGGSMGALIGATGDASNDWGGRGGAMVFSATVLGVPISLLGSILGLAVYEDVYPVSSLLDSAADGADAADAH